MPANARRRHGPVDRGRIVRSSRNPYSGVPEYTRDQEAGSDNIPKVWSLMKMAVVSLLFMAVIVAMILIAGWQ